MSRPTLTRTAPVAVCAALLAAAIAYAGVGHERLAPAPARADQTPAGAQPGGAGFTPYLRFTGTGHVDVKPDRAEISVAVNTTGDTSREALGKASRDSRKVIDRLKADGVAAKDLQTQDASTYQDFETKRWNASISIRVSTTPGKAGSLLTDATKAGADTVSGPSFSVQDQHAAFARALKDAMADTRSKADAAAAEVGGTVGTVLSVEEAPQASGGPVMYADAAAGARSESVPVEAGTQSITATVTVTYRLGS